MIVGVFFRIIEILVTTYCGIKLVTNTENPRFENKFARILFWLLVWAWAVTLIANIYFTKYSPIEYMLTFIWYCFIIVLFYRMHLFKAFTRVAMFWFNLLYLRDFAVLTCCSILQQPSTIYAAQTEPYHWLHILLIAITTLGILLLYHFMHDKTFIYFKKDKTYIFVTIFLIIQNYLLEYVLFDAYALTTIPKIDYLILCGTILWSFLTAFLIVFFIQNHTNMKWRYRMIHNNYETVQQQYELLDSLYNEKRRQIHDYRQQNELLTSYLENQQITEALQYLSAMKEYWMQEGIVLFTKIPVIDNMLNSKMQLAKNYNITMHIECDILTCPLSQNDMCIVLGNLIDNALEATQELEKDKRLIKISIKQVKPAFLLTIEILILENASLKMENIQPQSKAKIPMVLVSKV